MSRRAEIAQRLDRIAYGCRRGQSYSQTKARLASLASNIVDPELAQRIREAIGPLAGTSLGNRYDVLVGLRDELAEPGQFARLP